VLAIYLVAAIIGGGLVLFSAFGGLHGHGDAHFGGDADHPGLDAHHGDAADAGAFWLPFFSLRFYVYALAAFGILGALLTATKTGQEPTTVAASTATGLATGWIASAVVRWLTRADSSSAASHADFMGAIGTVTVPVRPGAPGKVRTRVKGDIIDLLALPAAGEEIGSGEEVAILDMDGSTALVGRAATVLGELERGSGHAD
jgi:membrane protein implicated in regulation of membrane protease activity